MTRLLGVGEAAPPFVVRRQELEINDHRLFGKLLYTYMYMSMLPFMCLVAYIYRLPYSRKLWRGF